MGDTLLDFAQRKRALRSLLLKRRASLNPARRRAASRRAACALLRSRELARARRVGLYLAQGAELDPAPLCNALRRRGKKLYLPVTLGTRRMIFVRCTARQRALCRASGFRQPRRRRGGLAARGLDLLVLPLVGYSADGIRLGRGGGHYDRALAGTTRRPLRIGYAYACQRVDALPREPWDQLLHAIVTEDGLLRIRRSGELRGTP